MWSDCVVLLTPSSRQNLYFQQHIEDLSIQTLISQLSVEGFDVAIVSGTAKFNEQRLHADPTLPLSESESCKLRPLVRSNVIRNTSTHEQITQPLQDRLAGHPTRNIDG